MPSPIRRFALPVALSLFISSCALPPPPTEDGPTQSPTVARAQSADGSVLFPTARGFNVPGTAGGLNNTARVLAGLPSEGPAASSLAWDQHAKKLNDLWSDFAWRHEQPIRNWISTATPDLRAHALFYPFSGPDFLFANAFFPTAETMVLCGLEPCEPLPALDALSPPEVAAGLDGLHTAINTVMQFSFFITKDMRNDLNATRFKGVLPVILTFMARSGHTIQSLDLVQLDAQGNPIIIQGAQGSAPGALIRCLGPDGRSKRIFYFRQDLSDDGLRAKPAFLRFVSSMGAAPAFAKSASYLMHESGFDTIRDYLAANSSAIVQDPSGVPYRSLLKAGMKVSLYGNYAGTLDIFKQHHQADLIQAYAQGGAQPLSFGIGYLYEPTQTCLMVARRR